MQKSPISSSYDWTAPYDAEELLVTCHEPSPTDSTQPPPRAKSGRLPHRRARETERPRNSPFRTTEAVKTPNTKTQNTHQKHSMWGQDQYLPLVQSHAQFNILVYNVVAKYYLKYTLFFKLVLKMCYDIYIYIYIIYIFFLNISNSLRYCRTQDPGDVVDLDPTPPTLHIPKPTHLHPQDVDPTPPPGSSFCSEGLLNNLSFFKPLLFAKLNVASCLAYRFYE